MHLVVCVLYFLRLLRGAFSPNTNEPLSCSDNFTDKIWLISIILGHAYVKGLLVNFDTLSAER